MIFYSSFPSQYFFPDTFQIKMFVFAKEYKKTIFNIYFWDGP